MPVIHRLFVCGLLISSLFFGACTKHEVEVKPIKVEPIYIKIDVNIRVDKELDNFFDDIDEISDTASVTEQ